MGKEIAAMLLHTFNKSGELCFEPFFFRFRLAFYTIDIYLPLKKVLIPI